MLSSQRTRRTSTVAVVLAAALTLGVPTSGIADERSRVVDAEQLEDTHKAAVDLVKDRAAAERRDLKARHDAERAQLDHERETALASYGATIAERLRAHEAALSTHLVGIAEQEHEELRRVAEEADRRRAELSTIVDEARAVAASGAAVQTWSDSVLDRYQAQHREAVERADRTRLDALAAIEGDTGTRLEALDAEASGLRAEVAERRRQVLDAYTGNVREARKRAAERAAALEGRRRGRDHVKEIDRYVDDAVKAAERELADRLETLADLRDAQLKALTRSQKLGADQLESARRGLRRDADERRAQVGEAHDRAVEVAKASLADVRAVLEAAVGGDDDVPELLGERVEKWTESASDAVRDRSERRRKDAMRAADADGKVLAAEGERQRRQIERDFDAAERALEARQKQADKALERRTQRELRLLRSEHYLASTRLASYLKRTRGLVPVEGWYHPTSDPGSPWNVGRRIGLDGLPASLTGAGVDVAMIDTGVVDVPGLAESKVEVGPDFSFEDADPELRARDTNGHGTHLAGLVVGRDGEWLRGDRKRTPDRFLGVAPDARLISVKAGTATGATDVSQVIAAVNWVIANKDTQGRDIRVLILAYGTDSVQDPGVDPLAHAVERAWHAGITVVVAAGNDGWSTPRLALPAADPYVIAVGASTPEDAKRTLATEYTNRGGPDRGLDILAPGHSVVGLRNPGSFSDGRNERGRAGARFVRGSGTSQAAAVAGGAVALLLQARPHLTPDEVKAVLRASSQGSGDAEAGDLRIDRAIKEKIPRDALQEWSRSDGTGSLEASRGSFHVEIDGQPLVGEVDVFGRDWSGSSWRLDSWTGDAWQGNQWAGNQWAGNQWAGNSWRNDHWAGAAWTGSSWRDHAWTGSSWRGARWTGNQWAGNQWAKNAWRKQAWVKNSWRGSTWREHAWLAEGRR